jgi:hypothetical protein
MRRCRGGWLNECHDQIGDVYSLPPMSVGAYHSGLLEYTITLSSIFVTFLPKDQEKDHETSRLALLVWFFIMPCIIALVARYIQIILTKIKVTMVKSQTAISPRPKLNIPTGAYATPCVALVII